MELTVDTLDRFICELRSLLGPHFGKMVGLQNLGTRGPLQSQVQGSSATHPFGRQWARLKNDVGRSKALGKLQLSPDSLFLLDLFASLSSASRDPQFDVLLSDLATPSMYKSTAFEAHILHAYLQTGLPISIVPKSIVPGERTPDFKIQIGEQAVCIECKSLEDPSEEEAGHWLRLCSRIAKLVLFRGGHWRITFSAERTIDAHEAERVFVRASALIADIHPGESRLTNHVKWRVEHGDASGTFPRRCDLGWIEIEGSTTDDLTLILGATVLVEVEQHFDADLSERIRRTVRNAAEQIGSSSIGVIHIELPHRDATRLLAVHDAVFDRTLGRLAATYPMIACVGLVGRFIPPNIREGGAAINSHFVNIPNLGAGVALPDGFAMLGAEGIDPGLTETGTIFLEFELFEALFKQEGRSLYCYCSHDAQRQVRLWQSFEGCFRADIVTPKYGRRVFNGDLNHLEPGRVHKLALSYCSDGISVGCNGRSIASIDHQPDR